MLTFLDFLCTNVGLQMISPETVGGSSSFLQRFSIACYAERCTNYSKSVLPSVCLSVHLSDYGLGPMKTEGPGTAAHINCLVVNPAQSIIIYDCNIYRQFSIFQRYLPLTVTVCIVQKLQRYMADKLLPYYVVFHKPRNRCT